jgi:hypothetical protein
LRGSRRANRNGCGKQRSQPIEPCHLTD